MHKIREIFKSSTSVTYEWMGDSCYLADRSYKVSINGKIVLEEQRKNVFSLYHLEVNTNYLIEIITDDDTIAIDLKTEEESLCLNVMDFGAIGDGLTDDTQAIKLAIDVCPAYGRVYMPKGIYKCSPLFLKSKMTLELEKDAVILGDTDRSNYPILPAFIGKDMKNINAHFSTWEGVPESCFASLMSLINVQDLKIIGQGSINGNADLSDWWQNPKEKRGAWRPNLLYIAHSNDVAIQGVKFMNSPSWTIHPFFSDHIRFLDFPVENPKDSPNTDGLDPESCYDIDIIGLDFSVGDDCIAIKSGKFDLGQLFERPSEKIHIRNCRMRFGHGAVVLGSEMSGGIRDIHVTRCLFQETDRGLRIKTRRGRGDKGVIENIHFENIKMDYVETPFVINMFYFCDPDGKTEYVWSKEKLEVDHRTPRLTSFSFKNIICSHVTTSACYIYGLPEQPIEEVLFDHVSITYAKDTPEKVPAMMSFVDPVCRQGFFLKNVNRIRFNKVNISGQKGQAYILEDYQEIKASETQQWEFRKETV